MFLSTLSSLIFTPTCFQQLSKEVKFKYKFYMVPGGGYGSLKNGRFKILLLLLMSSSCFQCSSYSKLSSSNILYCWCYKYCLSAWGEQSQKFLTEKGVFWAESIISLNICTNSGQKHFHATTLVNEEFDHNLQGQHLGISLWWMSTINILGV